VKEIFQPPVRSYLSMRVTIPIKSGGYRYSMDLHNKLNEET